MNTELIIPILEKVDKLLEGVELDQILEPCDYDGEGEAIALFYKHPESVAAKIVIYFRDDYARVGGKKVLYADPDFFDIIIEGFFSFKKYMDAMVKLLEIPTDILKQQQQQLRGTEP